MITELSSRRHRVIRLKARHNDAEFRQITKVLQVDDAVRLRRLQNCPVIAVIEGHEGSIRWDASLYLSHVALNSRSATGATVSSYAESIARWLDFVDTQRIDLEDSTEETLSLFRATESRRLLNSGLRLASATVGLRVKVARLMMQWLHVRAICPTRLGQWIVAESEASNQRRSARPGGIRNMKRIPRYVSLDEARRIVQLAPQPFGLMFKWAISTGLRRFEIASLRIADLPTSEELINKSDDLMPVKLLRKGGVELDVYVPTALIEETRWFNLIGDRRPTKKTDKNYIFSTRAGRAYQLGSISRVFRSCADAIGSKATLHHLRHAYAVNALLVLESLASDPHDPFNSLKTLQLLMGHRHLSTTEIYLSALSIPGGMASTALARLYDAIN